MGFFDDIFGQPFGGMFDMNGDGKTDLGVTIAKMVLIMVLTPRTLIARTNITKLLKKLKALRQPMIMKQNQE